MTVNTGLRDGDELDYLSEAGPELKRCTWSRQEGFVALVPTDASPEPAHG